MDCGDLKELQIIQNKAAQVVTDSPPRAERKLMYDKLQWLTVNQLVYYHSILSAFKIRINQEPEHLASILCKTSRNSRIMIPNFSLTLVCQSFTVRAAEYWNHLPLNIRLTNKIGVFKQLVKNWIVKNVPRFLD